MAEKLYQWASNLEIDEYSRDLVLEFTGSWEILDPLNYDLTRNVCCST